MNQKLLEHKYQHCDVKLSNTVYNKDKNKVLYIDSGDLGKIGEERLVGTPYGQSSNLSPNSLELM